jgi:hypothetical protein
MAERTTNFPSDTGALLFRGVCDIFAEDPVMVAAGVQFRTWAGERTDFAPPATGSMPIIRLSPKLMPNELDAQGSTTSVMNVIVECYARGWYAEDILNMWGAVQNCMVRLKPFRNTNVQCFLGNIANTEFATGAYRSFIMGPTITDYGSKDNVPEQYMTAVGSVVLKWRRPA